MKTKVLFVLITILLVPGILVAQVSYDKKKKLISIKADGQNLSEVLREISSKTGVAFYINPSLDRKVYADITSQPVDEALKQVVKPLNNAVVYKGNDVRSIKIFERSETEATAKISAPVVSDEKPKSAKQREAESWARRREIARKNGTLKQFARVEAQHDKAEKLRAKHAMEQEKQRERRRAEWKKTLKRMNDKE